jgi:hypothetical protein
MPFSERIKHIAKVRAAFRCCACHKPFVEVHHLRPEADGGDSSLSNAAPLCASCHDLFGGNPEKRKTLMQMRDSWWSKMAERHERLTDPSESAPPFEIAEDPYFKGGLLRSRMLLYHCVFPKEDFETSAKTLLGLVQWAQRTGPNKRRILGLDIEGHRTKKGRFDSDMFELQINFLGRFMIQYLSELNTPLIHLKNKKLQNNDIPTELHFFKKLDDRAIAEAVEKNLDGIWFAEKGTMLRLSKDKEVIATKVPSRIRRQMRAKK